MPEPHVPQPLTCACHGGYGIPCDHPGGCGSPGGCCAPRRPAPAERCAACGRKSTEPLCDPCRTRAAEQLAELPALRDRMDVFLTGGGGDPGEWVSGGGFGSRPPLVMDVLNLLRGGGSIADFAHTWAADWRRAFGYHDPADTMANAATLIATMRGPEPGQPWQFPDDPDERAGYVDKLVTAYAHMHTKRSAEMARILARTDTHTDSTDPDPLIDQWRARFGGPITAAAVRRDLKFLTDHLPRGLDLPTGPDFAVHLRNLSGDAHAAVGDRSDLVRVGRCPEPKMTRAPDGEVYQRQQLVTDPDGTQRYEPVWCGRVMWQDPYATVIVCPGCKQQWQLHRALEWMRLGRLIADVWTCPPCKDGRHERCTGPRRCDCRHTRRGAPSDPDRVEANTDANRRATAAARWRNRQLLELTGATPPELSEVDQAEYERWLADRTEGTEP